MEKQDHKVTTLSEAIERLMEDDVLGDLLAYWEGGSPTKKDEIKRQFLNYERYVEGVDRFYYSSRVIERVIAKLEEEKQK